MTKIFNRAAPDVHMKLDRSRQPVLLPLLFLIAASMPATAATFPRRYVGFGTFFRSIPTPFGGCGKRLCRSKFLSGVGNMRFVSMLLIAAGVATAAQMYAAVLIPGASVQSIRTGSPIGFNNLFGLEVVYAHY